jgi:hypothetical protein
MSNGQIVRLIPIAGSQFNGRAGYAGIAGNFPASNLADIQPKKVCQGGAGGGTIGIQVDLDLGADTAFDTIAALYTNLSLTASWAVYGWTNAAGLPALGAEGPGDLILGSPNFGGFGVAPTTRERRRHGLLQGASITRRYIRFSLQDTAAANPDGFVNCGNFVVGQSIRPEFNYELGSGRKIDDQSIIRVLPGGETVPVRGGRTPIWRGTWSNLSEAELRQIYSLMLEVGIGSPILAIEEPDSVTGQCEGLHYGLLEGLDFNERVQLEKQRVDVRVRDLV